MTDARSPLELARALVPSIHACATQIERERELPRPLFEALADAGLFQLALPRSLGCAEIDLPTYVQVVEELGRADASTAWTVNQGAIFATYAARMPAEVTRAIWIDPPRAVVANTPLVTARAVAVPGGYRVSGRQGFSTGCRHATWLAAQAQLIEHGAPRLLTDGRPEVRYLFVPVAEARIEDTWLVHGLRGTGTHHFILDDVFVPEERTVLVDAPSLYEHGPLYRIPRTLVFASGDAAVALGVARAAIDAFVELASAKTPRATVGLLRDQPMVQADVGFAEARLRSGRALLTETVRETWAAATSGAVALEHRAALRLAATHTIWLAAEVVDAMYQASGPTAVYEDHPLQRYFQDIHVITQHIQARRAHYALIGRYRLGVELAEGEL